MSASASERTPLLARSVSESSHESYGAAPSEDIIRTRNSRRIIILAGLRMAAVFLASCIFLGGTLWLALPPLSPYVTRLICDSCGLRLYHSSDDRDDLRIPKSFAQLQALNALLKKYRHVYPYRIVVCFVTVYLLCVSYNHGKRSLTHRDIACKRFPYPDLCICPYWEEPSGVSLSHFHWHAPVWLPGLHFAI
jgi:hypothetical protein